MLNGKARATRDPAPLVSQSVREKTDQKVVVTLKEETESMRKSITSFLFSLTLATFVGDASTANPSFTPDRIYIPLATHHHDVQDPFPGFEKFNEFNPGVVAVWEKRYLNLDYGVGVFKNSFGDPAATFSIGYNMEVAPDLEIGAVINIADYGNIADFLQTQILDTSFIVIPAAQVRYKNGFIQFIPDTKGAIAMAGLTFALK